MIYDVVGNTEYSTKFFSSVKWIDEKSNPKMYKNFYPIEGERKDHYTIKLEKKLTFTRVSRI